ncbi:bifunctional pyridoxamine 5'-phosphate oxidase family protein/GNAT family N-acetyltransferase [Plantactinospora sp. WMMC1484]|uniref:bifunctional pyridoxamine 5'-phosphate oxidase family protein/GNAT family N-acetyltransferase n=1 Tax=Plantactinospora sp. WMMC1484 TaxID=3404122 RepID=UPI003BF50406
MVEQTQPRNTHPRNAQPEDDPAARYPQTRRTTASRDRGRTDYRRATAHDLLDEAYHCHLGFVVDGEPRVLPTLHVRIGDVLYLHGSTGSRPLLAARRESGLPVCVAVTALDGLVYGRSQFHHSANYRSVVAHGTAHLVEGEAEKRAVLTALVEKVGRGRAADSRPPSRRELAETAVLALPLREVSVRSRTGGVRDEPADHDLPHWAGVLPLRTVAGRPEPDAGVTAELPAYLRDRHPSGSAPFPPSGSAPFPPSGSAPFPLSPPAPHPPAPPAPPAHTSHKHTPRPHMPRQHTPPGRHGPALTASPHSPAPTPARHSPAPVDAWYSPAPMAGDHVRLEPLAESHVDGLYAATRDSEVWPHLSTARPEDPAGMAAIVGMALDAHRRGERVPWAQLDAVTGEVVGTTSYYEINPVHRAVAIGHTFLGRRWWRTGVNTEAKLLLLGRAFDVLGAERVVWHTDIRNERSQRAIARLGATREAVLRRHRQRPDGSWRDTVQYAMIADEWPKAQVRLRERLRVAVAPER